MLPYNPIKEIQLAARVGFLSKSVWIKYFSCGTLAWRNRVWRNLLSRGYFKLHSASRAKSVIVLNKNNPIVQKYIGDDAVQSPSIATLDHDEIVVESFLRLDQLNYLAYAKFEAELKKEDLRNKKYFDPNDKTKYPDLLIALRGPNENKKIAIELELSRKEPKRYRQMMNAYMSCKEISMVLFITDIETIKNAIKSAIRDTYYPDWERPIGFVSLKDWIVDPALAIINFSDEKTTLEKLASTEAKS